MTVAWKRRLTILSMMSPWLIGMVVFFGYPLVSTVVLSFEHYDLLSPARWIGLANYRYMGQDVNFWPGVRNTIWMIVVALEPAGADTTPPDPESTFQSALSGS